MMACGEAPEEIKEALGHLTYRAKRRFPRVGSDEFPTDWDKSHKHIDNMLDALEEIKENT